MFAESHIASPTVAYGELCTSYRAIDEFRAKLLGFLPLASAGGIFFLLNRDLTAEVKDLLTPIGVFGILTSSGLFSYELYGILKCHALIKTGRHLEGLLGIEGQFVTRPRELFRFINEPFAAGIIYPAVLAAWVYLGWRYRSPEAAQPAALCVFVGGFVCTLICNLVLANEQTVRRLLRRLPVTSRGAGKSLT